jgi:heme/copper-type cytochrome/quinol oxidase subunit 2
MSTEPNTPAPPDRDWRAVVVIIVGLAVILTIVLAAVVALPGDVAEDKVNTKGQSMVSLGTAAFTAVTSMIAAYFGVKAANLAREDADKRGEDHAIQIAHLAGAADPDKARDAIDKALQEMRTLRGK